MAVSLNDWATGGFPSYGTGHLLVAMYFGSGNVSNSAGWTNLCNYNTTWQYDSLCVSYKIAQSTSETAPFSISNAFSFTGISTTTPVSGSATGSLSAAPATIGSSLTLPADGYRLTVMAGYGAGGNPAFSGSTFTPASGSITMMVGGTDKVALFRGGSGGITVTSPNYGFQSVRYLSMIISAPVLSGFFAMF